MIISWYKSIPVLKKGILNTVLYSVTNQKPVYISKRLIFQVMITESFIDTINVLFILHLQLVVKQVNKTFNICFSL